MILGLNFGHDSAVSILDSTGRCLLNYTSERHSRVKHASGLKLSLIKKALDSVSTEIENIAFVAITSTQCYELLLENDLDDEEVNLVYGHTGKHPVSHPIPNLHQLNGTMVTNTIMKNWIQKNEYYLRICQFGDPFGSKVVSFPYLTWYGSPELWNKPLKLDQIRDTNYSQIVRSNEAQKLFAYPCTLKIFGKSIPAYAIQHHISHIAYAFYSFDKNDMMLISHDGGFYEGGPNNGLICYGYENKIYPICPHHLRVGDFYDRVGVHIGFELMGSAGKVMGLSAYGKPKYYHRAFVGNYFDNKSHFGGMPIHESFLREAHKIADINQVNVTPENITIGFKADLAASIQKVLEETMLELTSVTSHIRYKHFKNCKNLALSGGTALNCPANSLIYQSGYFDNVFIPPAVDDSGLALGAAKYLYYHVLNSKRKVNNCRNNKKSMAYLGSSFHKHEVEEYLKDNNLKYDVDTDYMKAVKHLMSGGICGFFSGRSEHGPRALGSRTILADPRVKSNWEKTNEIKRREKWRPFAPIILENKVDEYFFSCPHDSPFMLFNGVVKSNQIPAVTHVDNSARVQTVSEETGKIHGLLNLFYHKTSCPILLNTSFNGPGEPIVDSIDNAVKAFKRLGLTALWIEGFWLEKSDAK